MHKCRAHETAQASKPELTERVMLLSVVRPEWVICYSNDYSAQEWQRTIPRWSLTAQYPVPRIKSATVLHPKDQGNMTFFFFFFKSHQVSIRDNPKKKKKNGMSRP